MRSWSEDLTPSFEICILLGLTSQVTLPAAAACLFRFGRLSNCLSSSWVLTKRNKKCSYYVCGSDCDSSDLFTNSG